MRTPVVAFAGVVLVSLSACGTAQQDRAGQQEGDVAVAELDSLRQAWRGAAAQGDIERYMGYLTPDVVVMAPGQPAMNGQDAFRPFVGAFFAGFRIESDENVSEEIVVAGDWAFDRGVYHSVYLPVDSAPAVRDDGQYIYLAHHDVDGWKYARIIWNSVPPVDPPGKGGT